MHERQKLASLTLDELADKLAVDANSLAHSIAMAEFTRRQTLAQQQAADAQIDASSAQIKSGQAITDTAEYTRKNARYMLWSVIVLAITGSLSFVAAAWQILHTAPH